MAKIQPDGVVEAVRYLPGGEIAWVRAYERRGPSFSDHVILDRPMLVARLKAGKRFYAGQRTELMASTFKLGYPLRLAQAASAEVVVAGKDSPPRDHLEGVPLI
jgi:hypothetical protein